MGMIKNKIDTIQFKEFRKCPRASQGEIEHWTDVMWCTKMIEITIILMTEW